MSNDLNRLIASSMLFCLLSFPAIAERAWDPSGFWTGHLNYRDADLPVRVDIRKNEGTWEALLDIPSLVYAGQAIAMEDADDESFSLDFPFGIGVIRLQQDGARRIHGARQGFSLVLESAERPGIRQVEIDFGAVEPRLSGTLYLPVGAGPVPVAVLIAGSANANRQNWSYASWVGFYLEKGMGAFIYDRRADNSLLPDGSIATIADHARDLADAIRILGTLDSVDASRIGVAGASRGAWIAMAVGNHIPDLAFVLLSSAAPVTPAEQEISSVLTGMDQDGLSSTDIAAARSYLRLYFYVAQSGDGWELLETAIKDGAESNWLQYVDQPRSLTDLRWWHANMNVDAIGQLRGIQAPVMAIWGGADFITPWIEYREKLRVTLNAAGNENVVTRVFAGADHRIEVGFGEDDEGNWHWFGIAPGALEEIGDWLEQVLRE
jgi:pimeloyl-ACP methyl ester carboxylesterase